MEKYYTTGQFAKLASVTERTIRYYDKIGLLKPSFVMNNGYRKYTNFDLLKLQKIITLKNLGFTIEEIFPIMLKKQNLKESFTMQLELLEKEINHLQRIKDSMEILTKNIDETNPNWNQIISMLHLASIESNLVEQYKNSNNLNVRIQLHSNYSVNSEGWFNWLFNKIDFSRINRLLEVGCGNGNLWENQKLDLRNREIFLSDISEGMISEVRKKLGRNFNCIVFDCQQIPFKDEYFDALIANHVLFYLHNVEKGLLEINRVLKQGGIFYCSTYGKNHMQEITKIVKEYDSKIELSYGKLYEIFGLDNGEDILKKHFRKVKKIEYPDSLIINEAKPLVDYIMSCHGNQNEIITPKIDDFYSYIENMIQKNGAIHITKQAGMFICEK